MTDNIRYMSDVKYIHLFYIFQNCTQCTKHLPTRMSHSRHICPGTPAPPKPVVLKREFQCNRCPLSYDKDYLLEAHVQTAHPKRRGRPRKFTEKEASASKGTQLITTKKYYQCQICGIGFMLKVCNMYV